MSGGHLQLLDNFYKEYYKYQYDDFDLDEKKCIDEKLKKYIINELNDKLYGIFKFNEFDKLETFNIRINGKTLFFDRTFFIGKIKDVMSQYNKLYVIDEIKYFLKKSIDIKVLLVQTPN